MVGNLGAGTNLATPGSSLDIESIRAENEAVKANIPNTKALAEAAKARQAANNSAGTGAMSAGSAQQAQGQAQVGMGAGLGVVGGGLTFKGLAMQTAGATSNLMSAGAGTALIATGKTMETIGVGMITSGITMVGTGVVTLASANENIQKGTSHLAKAAQDGIISKEQAKVANQEMIRSQIFESKIQMIEATMLELQNSGQLEGSTGENLSPEQLDKLKQNGQSMFDKAFDAGADALANNGIMSLKDGADTRYFMLNADGNPAEVNVITGSDGKPQLDTVGRLQLDTNNPVQGRPALSDDQNLELKLNFAVMHQMKDMITGTPADPNAAPPKAAQPPLARITIDPNSGEISAGTFDLSNPQHLKEFAAITHAAGQNPPPLKYFKEGEELFFQKWDWAKNEGIGEKVSIKEMSGGNVDKSNPDWKNIAKTKAEAAFDKVGLGSSSDTYKLLQPLATESEQNDLNPLDLNAILHRTAIDPDGLRSNGSTNNNSSTSTGSTTTRNTNFTSFA